MAELEGDPLQWVKDQKHRKGRKEMMTNKDEETELDKAQRIYTNQELNKASFI